MVELLEYNVQVMTLTLNKRTFNMSMIFCNSCDMLVDTDLLPESTYSFQKKQWTCQACLENKVDDMRQRVRDIEQQDMFQDPLLNWSGLR